MSENGEELRRILRSSMLTGFRLTISRCRRKWQIWVTLTFHHLDSIRCMCRPRSVATVLSSLNFMEVNEYRCVRIVLFCFASGRKMFRTSRFSRSLGIANSILRVGDQHFETVTSRRILCYFDRNSAGLDGNCRDRGVNTLVCGILGELRLLLGTAKTFGNIGLSGSWNATLQFLLVYWFRRTCTGNIGSALWSRTVRRVVWSHWLVQGTMDRNDSVSWYVAGWKLLQCYPRLGNAPRQVSMLPFQTWWTLFLGIPWKIIVRFCWLHFKFRRLSMHNNSPTRGILEGGFELSHHFQLRKPAVFCDEPRQASRILILEFSNVPWVMETFIPIETQFFHWASWLAIHWKGGFLIEGFSVAVEISGLAFLTSIGGEPTVLLSEPNVVSFHDTCVDTHLKKCF